MSCLTCAHYITFSIIYLKSVVKCDWMLWLTCAHYNRRNEISPAFMWICFKKWCNKGGKQQPYSPCQNGVVERSHREDGKILYNRKVFTSEKELIKSVEKHMKRYNSTAKTSLNFKSPNEVVSKYFSKCNICLDN